MRNWSTVHRLLDFPVVVDNLGVNNFLPIRLTMMSVIIEKTVPMGEHILPHVIFHPLADSAMDRILRLAPIAQAIDSEREGNNLLKELVAYFPLSRETDIATFMMRCFPEEPPMIPRFNGRNRYGMFAANDNESEDSDSDLPEIFTDGSDAEMESDDSDNDFNLPVVPRRRGF